MEEGQENQIIIRAAMAELIAVVDMGDREIALEAISGDDRCVIGYDGRGRNVLHATAERGMPKVQLAALKAMAAVSPAEVAAAVTAVDDEHGDTPLHTALRHGKLQCAMMLARNRATEHAVGVVNKDGDTALHLAAAHGDVELVREILRRAGRGADHLVAARNGEYRTAAEIASGRAAGAPTLRFFTTAYHADMIEEANSRRMQHILDCHKIRYATINLAVTAHADVAAAELRRILGLPGNASLTLPILLVDHAAILYDELQTLEDDGLAGLVLAGRLDVTAYRQGTAASAIVVLLSIKQIRRAVVAGDTPKRRSHQPATPK